MSYSKINVALFATEETLLPWGPWYYMFNCFENKLVSLVFCFLNRVGLLRLMTGCEILEGLPLVGTNYMY